MKKPAMLHCILCGRITLQRCAQCKEPICQQCQVVKQGKIYCTPRHRDNDNSLSRLLRGLEQSLH